MPLDDTVVRKCATCISIISPVVIPNVLGSIVFAKDMDLQALRKEKAIEKAIELAIDRDTIEVYYQPIYNVEKQCYTSAEALVRIHDDSLGNISPEVAMEFAAAVSVTSRLIWLGST